MFNRVFARSQRIAASSFGIRASRSLRVLSAARRASGVIPALRTNVAPTVPVRALSSQLGAPLRKKVTTVDLQKMKEKNKPITMVTAYTYPSAFHVNAAEIDVLLVGDSLAMVELGHNTTLPVTVDEMLYHCKAVSRVATRCLLVGDMPFGSYEESPEVAYRTATRFLKEAGMDAVKIEGGRAFAETIRKLVDGGVAVMGHIGLTPQRISVLGGFRAQGRTLQAARELIADARALQEAGCFAIVIECVPGVVAEVITQAVDIPTIGIGAGPHTSGQVLVFHDLLGMLEHEHHAKVAPSFCKTYAQVGQQIQTALEQYRKEVETKVFPGDSYSPYKMMKEQGEEVRETLLRELEEIKSHQRADGNDIPRVYVHPAINSPLRYAKQMPANPELLVHAKDSQQPTTPPSDEPISVYSKPV